MSLQCLLLCQGVIYTWLCITGYPEVLKQYDILCMVCYDIVFKLRDLSKNPSVYRSIPTYRSKIIYNLGWLLICNVNI